MHKPSGNTVTPPDKMKLDKNKLKERTVPVKEYIKATKFFIEFQVSRDAFFRNCSFLLKRQV